MTIERLETKQRMSRIVKHNGTIYLCGQVCDDATKGITEQTQTMLDKVDELLMLLVVTVNIFCLQLFI